MVLLDFWPDFRKIADEPPVIRASEARLDIPPRRNPARAIVCPCKEARVQKVLERSIGGAEGTDRFRHLVLVRIACALRGASKSEIAADLMPIAGGPPAAGWRARVEREI